MEGKAADDPPAGDPQRRSAAQNMENTLRGHNNQHALMPQRVYLTMTNVAPEEWACFVEDRRKSIGRSPDAAVRIPDRFTYVSRQHAEVWRENSKTFLCDLGSKAGTQVNGIWLKRNTPTNILVGDHIWLGAAELDVVAHLSPLAGLMAETGVSPLDGDDENTSHEMATVLLPVRMLLETLTPAESEIALWLCRGYFDDVKLGQLLHRSPHTVRTQVGSVMRKLKLHSRHDIIGLLKRTE